MPFFSNFLFGFLAALVALFFELLLFSLIGTGSFGSISTDVNFVFAVGGMSFLLLSAVIEEVCKYIALRSIQTHTQTLSILFTAIPFSIGFAILELTLLFSSTEILTKSVAFAAFGIVAIHFITTLWITFALKKFPLSLALTIGIAALVHASYNIFFIGS